MLRAHLGGDGATLACILAGAPSIDVARHLWRALDAAWREATQVDGSRARRHGVRASARDRRRTRAARVTTECFRAPSPTLRGSPRSCASTARWPATPRSRLSNALVATDAIDVARLPEILGWSPPARFARGGRARCRSMRFPRRRWHSTPDARPCTCASCRESRSRAPGSTSPRTPGWASGASRSRASSSRSWRSRRCSVLALPRAAAAAPARGGGGARRAARGRRADLREQRHPQVPRLGGRADGGHQRASRAGRPRRRRAPALAVVAVRAAGRGRLPLSALSARSRGATWPACSSRCCATAA